MNPLGSCASLRTWSTAAIMATLAVACHGETGPAAEGGSGTEGGTTDGRSAQGGGSPGHTASGSSATVGRGGASNSSLATSTNLSSSKTGQVLVLNVHQESITSGLSATFRDISATTVACEPSQSFGDCTFSPSCEDSWMTTYVSAGAITMTSAQPAMTVTLEPGLDNAYNTGTGSMGAGFSGGESAHIAASGATIPAFTADITIPLTLLIDSPKPDSSGLIIANADSDLIVKFSRGTAGVDVFLQSFTPTGMLTCQAKSEVGSMTICKEALALLDSTFARLWTFGYKIVEAGDWSITVGSIMEAYTPDKSHPVKISVR